jgi:hypothetical protein
MIAFLSINEITTIFRTTWDDRLEGGAEMRKLLRTGAAVAMLCAMGGNVLAATAGAAGCARPDEFTALKAAAVQQKLMVAALSCHAAQLYNKFVVAYRKDLQASDRALQNFFRRINGRSGTADYHAYKTRLANASSMESIGNMPAYCASAKAAFDTVLNGEKTSLREFVSAQDARVDDRFAPCPVRTAGVKGPAKAKLSAKAAD